MLSKSRKGQWLLAKGGSILEILYCKNPQQKSFSKYFFSVALFQITVMKFKVTVREWQR